MFKYFLFLLFIFTAIPSFASDKIDEAKLQAEYGSDLNKAPFFIRFNFQKEYKKDWSGSDYPERRAFLTEYETNLAKEQVQEKAEARAAALEEKKRLREKKDELRKKQDELKAEQAKEKAEEREDEERQKAFNQSIAAQQKELEQMQKLATQGN